MKVVFNNCYGGFGLSQAAVKRLAELGVSATTYGDRLPRHDARLVQVVEELGAKASGGYAKLEIRNVDGPYRIDEYDGLESVETPNSYDWVHP